MPSPRPSKPLLGVSSGSASSGPTPEQLEAGEASKYARKRRRRGSGGLGAPLGLLACSAAPTAAGVAAALLLLACGAVLHGSLAHPRGSQGQRPAGGPAVGSSGHQGVTAAAGIGSNCTVRLAEADRSLLQREMLGMVRALSDRHAWTAGLPDALPGEAAADVVSPGQLAVPGVQPPRVVDEPFGAQTSANIPGVEDLHAELAAYNAALLADMAPDDATAAARQARPTAADLGLAPLDALDDIASLPQRIAFLNDLAEEVQAGESLRACLAATVSADVAGLRRELLPWLQYHTELGAAHFYLLYDGQDSEAVRLLGTIRHVTLLHIRAPWAAPADAARWHMYAASAGEVTARQWGGHPGNFELMVKQGFGEAEALRRAAADGMHWLLHLDPDELLHPGGPAFSLPAVLARVPPHVSALRFMNFEGQPEAADLKNRFEQVSLFRVHKHFIGPEAHWWRQKFKLGDNAAFLTLYANGKSAVRVDAPGVRQLGPHFFTGDPSPRWQTAGNPAGAWRDAVSDDTVVLHYAYSYESDVAAKAHRSCPDAYLQAARAGDRAKVMECFVIDLDADAYMAAAAGPAAVHDFFLSRMVLGEGSRVRCADPASGRQGWCNLTDIERFKYLMLKLGLYRRLHAPAALLRQHERRIRQRMAAAASSGGSSGAAPGEASSAGDGVAAAGRQAAQLVL